MLGPRGAEYPLTPDELAEALAAFVRDYGLRLVGGCCARRPRTSAPSRRRDPVRHPGGAPSLVPSRASASLYAAVPFRQDTSVLMVGERTNANGSKIFRGAMLAERWEDCVAMAREQIRDGAHHRPQHRLRRPRRAADMAELADGWPRRPPC